jgi:hypothetical protein
MAALLGIGILPDVVGNHDEPPLALTEFHRYDLDIFVQLAS